MLISNIRQGNMIMRKIFYVLMLFLLSACATETGYQKVVDSWMGSSKINLINTWGIPTNNYKADEHTEYFSYVETSISTDSYGNIYNWKCQTTFTITDDVVTSWKYEGYKCRACDDGFLGTMCKYW